MCLQVWNHFKRDVGEDYENLIINDFLYSNNIIYKAFLIVLIMMTQY